MILALVIMVAGILFVILVPTIIEFVLLIYSAKRIRKQRDELEKDIRDSLEKQTNTKKP